MAKLEGLTLTVTDAVQQANISDPKGVSSLKNDDTTTTIYYKVHPSETESAGGNAATLRADKWSELRPGEAVAFTGAPSIYYLAATGQSGSARVVAGQLASANIYNVDANLGDVGVLDTTNTAIDPATESTAASIKTAVELLDNAVAGSELQVDVVAALPSGTNAIGKLAANADVNIGDVGLVNSANAPINPAEEDGNLASLLTQMTAMATALGNGATFITAPFSGLATGETMIGATASQYTRIYGIAFTVSAAATVTIQDGDSSTMIGSVTLDANGGYVLPFTNNKGAHWGKTTDANKVVKVVTTAGTVSGVVIYTSTTDA